MLPTAEPPTRPQAVGGVVAVPPAPAHPRASARTPARTSGGWLVPPVLLLATASAVLLVMRGLEEAFVTASASVLALSSAWILVSVFWPARADRTCPSCGHRGLKRLDSRSTRGVACTRCGSQDPTASSFLFAEEDDAPIEPTIEHERAAGRTRR